jgi:hypothetical protein
MSLLRPYSHLMPLLISMGNCIKIAFFLCLLPVLCQSQSDEPMVKVRKSNIQLAVGFLHLRLIDEGYTDSRLLFRGTNPAFRFGYGRETNQYAFNFAMSFVGGEIKSKSGNLPTDLYFGDMSLEYLRSLRSRTLIGKENKFFWGGRVSTINQGIVSMRTIDNVSIFSVHGVYIDLHDRLILNEKDAINVSFLLPVMVYTNRVLWNGGASKYTYREVQNIPRLMTTNGKFSFFNMIDNIQFDVSYLKKVGLNTSMEVRYGFIYTSSSIEAPIRNYSNRLLLGLKFFL